VEPNRALCPVQAVRRRCRPLQHCRTCDVLSTPSMPRIEALTQSQGSSTPRLAIFFMMEWGSVIQRRETGRTLQAHNILTEVTKFFEKKVKHQTHHHASPNCKSGFDPISTHCRTLEVGRPATGGRTDANARPQPGTRPTTAPCGTEKFRSQQELSVLKRRHMTDLDGQTTGVLEGWKQNCPPPSRATATGRTNGWSTQQGAQRSPTGELNVSARMPAAGIEGKGSVDIMAMEPVADHVPHKSYHEFNLKKQQHFTGMHTSPNSTRFAR